MATPEQPINPPLEIVTSLPAIRISGIDDSLCRERPHGSFGGASRDRTDDLIVANDALSQLSYSPTIGIPRQVCTKVKPQVSSGLLDYTSSRSPFKGSELVHPDRRQRNYADKNYELLFPAICHLL